MVLRYSPWRVLVWTAMFTRRMHSEAMRLLGIVTQQIVVFFPHWKVAPSLGNAEDKQTKRNAVVDIRRTSTVSSRHFSVLHFCFIWCSSTLQVLAPSRPPHFSWTPTFTLNHEGLGSFEEDLGALLQNDRSKLLDYGSASHTVLCVTPLKLMQRLVFLFGLRVITGLERSVNVWSNPGPEYSLSISKWLGGRGCSFYFAFLRLLNDCWFN